MSLHILEVPALSRADEEHIRFEPSHDIPEPVLCYELFFPVIEADGTENEGSGYGFPCDASGFVLLHQITDVGARNLWLLLRGVSPAASVRYGPGRIRSWEANPERVRGWMFCQACGVPVHLSGFTNTCEKCGADYNMGGSRLAPRSQWGAETGESVSDILAADADAREGRIGAPEDNP